jgi:hypothetical protein
VERRRLGIFRADAPLSSGAATAVFVMHREKSAEGGN